MGSLLSSEAVDPVAELATRLADAFEAHRVRTRPVHEGEHRVHERAPNRAGRLSPLSGRPPVLAASPSLPESGSPDEDLALILERTPCDVGVLAGGGKVAEGPIVAPFAGVEHDWSAIEVAAWLAGALGTTLRLLGTEADPRLGRRDASRLLARASLLVQQVVGIVTEPVLVPPGEEGVLQAARDARVLVVGLSDRWRTEGIGRVRLAIVAGVDVRTLFV